jgi:formyltetrahydrofolate-dependent phosphoribosylglycinamide formyltransferase
MFNKLSQKWKVSSLKLTLIILTFAIGGSATGYVAKKIMNVLAIHHDWLWTIIYILLIILIWPIAVLIISIFFGQFRFFSGYIKRIGIRMGLVKNKSAFEKNSFLSDDTLSNKNIAIFASGNGTNAQKIIQHFKNSSDIKVTLVVCNKPDAGVLQIAERENIPSLLIEKEKFFRGNGYVDELKEKKIDLIVLAGFLWKIPENLLAAYPQKIINIHPALLPKYGGKGMYGNSVHEAVLKSKEKESGITIHYVNEHYDEGDIILQVKCAVLDDDTLETLAQRIHALEYANYPVVIEELAGQLVKQS